MTAVLAGVRILEVAEHTFVPAASALLADLGAEVIKIEHVERGDGMRALAASGTAMIPKDVHVLLEHSNRGKKSLGLDLMQPDGLEVLAKLAATCDVFLTNKLPGVRKKLHIDLADIRAANPKIIYVAGTGQGERGPDADKGSYDSLAFWARSGIAMGVMKESYTSVPVPPGPGYGDSIGASTIAGGIMGALFHRERTGEATTVDVSLLGTAMWAMGQAMALSLLLEMPWRPPAEEHRVNPLVNNYLTKDGVWLALCCLQAGKYWPLLAERIGRADAAADERFKDQATILQNSHALTDIIRDAVAERTVAEWREALDDFTGQWTVVQDTLQAAADPQTVANGYLQPCETATGIPFQLVASPIQYDGVAATTARAPDFNEHGDEILGSIGYDMDGILDLKIRGVVA